MDKDLTINELESYLNVTGIMIDDLARKRNIDDVSKELTGRLNKLHSYRKKIISEIERKLDETFNTENKG